MTRFVMAFLLGLGLIQLSTGEEKAKLPPADAREKASKLIHDLFKTEFSRTTPAAKLSLAELLYKQAGESDNDLPAKYMLLKECAEVAASVNMDLSVHACESFVNTFGVPVGDANGIEPILRTVYAKATTPAAAQSLANFVLQVIEDAVAEDDLEAATRLRAMADTLAQRAKNAKLLKQVQQLGKDLELTKQVKEKVNVTLPVLKIKPDDPEANLVVGKYLCFHKGDWQKGLPMLVKGSDTKLKAAAEKDLETNPEDTANAVLAGDGWYNALSLLDGHPKSHIYSRIYTHYSNALPKVTGITKAKVEQRVVEVEKLLESKWENSKLWSVVKSAIRGKSYDTAAPQGGFISEKEYSEILPDGAILIGFNYTLKDVGDKNVLDYFQAIYTTPTGEKLGTAYGNLKAPKAGKLMTVKAKPGYAIGKMRIRGGGLWEGTIITFMRIDNKGTLKSDDAYESSAIGYTDNRMEDVGDGRPIIGIHGKLQRASAGAGVCTFGAYLAGEKPK